MRHIHRDRRNLTGAEILRCVQVLDKRGTAGRPKLASAEANSPMDDAPEPEPPTNGKSAAQTAALRALLE